MKQCPVCQRVYDNDQQAFCNEDGAQLNFVLDANQSANLADSPTVFDSPRGFAAAPVPQAKTNYLLIFGGIAALGLLLLIGGAFVLLLVIGLSANSKQRNLGDINTQPSPVTRDAAEIYKPEIIMAIRSANDAQVAAYGTYNVAPLNKYYMGEALKSTLTDVENLKKYKLYQSATIEKQDFQSFKINPAATEAEVRVTETWATIVYQMPSRRCVQEYPSHALPQTIYLKRQSDGWKVNVIVQEGKASPSKCSKSR